MPSILELYNSPNAPAAVLAAKAMGTTAAGRGVNFMDGGPAGPKFNPLNTPDRTDRWQDEFKELPQDTNVVPATTNTGAYPLSRWKPDALKLAFDGVGPSSLPSGHLGSVRFTNFKDSAGRNGVAGTPLHNYAPNGSTGGKKSFYDSLPAGSFAKLRADPNAAGYSAPKPGGIRG